jgi:hypothetical protein
MPSGGHAGGQGRQGCTDQQQRRQAPEDHRPALGIRGQQAGGGGGTRHAVELQVPGAGAAVGRGCCAARLCDPGGRRGHRVAPGQRRAARGHAVGPSWRSRSAASGGAGCRATDRGRQANLRVLFGNGRFGLARLGFHQTFELGEASFELIGQLAFGFLAGGEVLVLPQYFEHRCHSVRCPRRLLEGDQGRG